MICQLCQKDKKLIRSHIIPESFYRTAYPKNNGLMVSKGQHSKRLPIGIYDIEITCEECEKIFSRWDNYGSKFFLNILTSNQKTIKKDGIDFGITINNVNYADLKLFLLSVLWRASACKHSFFDQISLMLFEKKLREMIISSNPGTSEDFACMISKFNIEKTDVLHPPHKTRLDNGINGYRIFFFNSEVFIKVDKRTIGKYNLPLLSPEQPLIVIIKDPPKTIRLLYEARNDK